MQAACFEVIWKSRFHQECRGRAAAVHGIPDENLNQNKKIRHLDTEA